MRREVGLGCERGRIYDVGVWCGVEVNGWWRTLGVRNLGMGLIGWVYQVGLRSVAEPVARDEGERGLAASSKAHVVVGLVRLVLRNRVPDGFHWEPGRRGYASAMYE